jgi:hypothetical protein
MKGTMMQYPLTLVSLFEVCQRYCGGHVSSRSVLNCRREGDPPSYRG